jgi:hypothetical protein
MVLRSLPRLSPQALRFLCVENLAEFFSYVLIQGLEGSHCPILLSQSADFSSPLQVLQSLVLGFMSPSSGWVSDHPHFSTKPS